MKVHGLICLFILSNFSCLTNGVPTGGSNVKPGYHKIPGTKGLYKYHETVTVWDNAVATCAAEGASLYYPENDTEFRTVITYWQQTLKNNFSNKFFIGIRKSRGVFKTINGAPISNVYHGWLSGEPNNEGGNENCVEAYGGTGVWGLNDKACDVRKTFICKWPIIEVQCSSASCADVTTESNIDRSSGYHYIPGTNGLFKYHDTASVWDDAAATCAAEGASLYYANDENDFRTVITYWHRTMKNDFQNIFFIGIKKSKGVFKTLNGTPISNVYHGWLSDEPNNEGGNENCVEAYAGTGVWGLNDKACDVHKTFICKLPMIEVQCSSASCTDVTTESSIDRSSGYHYIPGTNGLYKYHDTVTVWDDAAATCAAEGASLYYADDENDFRTVITYWQRTMENDFQNQFFVGIKKSGGVFKTINGIPVSNVYHGWLSGEPNNEGGNENCVEAYGGTGVWGLNDKACDVRKTFICKWPMIDVQCSGASCTEKQQ